MNHPKILIVDEHDQPIGEATYEEVDAQGLIRRLVRLMIENDQGMVLLQKRREEDLVYPGCWDNSVAGHVDAGENNSIAIKRELAEELDIEVENLAEFGEYYNEVKPSKFLVKKFNHLYKAKYNGPIDQIKTEEVSCARWVSLEDLKCEIQENPADFTDGVKEVIKRFY